jgi:hypothetical protein
VGRTGTFIGIYAVLSGVGFIDPKRPKLDVYNFVQKMREVR